MFTDLKKVYYQCLDAIYIIAYNGYLHYRCRFHYTLDNDFFKKRNLCKLCHIESIKYAHVKLLIFYNKIFNDIREAKKIDLFSMEYK